MNRDPSERARARLALRQVVHRHLLVPNVTCVDLGLAEDDENHDELRIRLHVRRKLEGPELATAVGAGHTERFPVAALGFRTEVLEGVYRPQVLDWNSNSAAGARARRADPLRGGVSISDERRIAYGTLGAKVIDQVSGDEMILSNWHVLAGDWRALPGRHVLQPGRLDGGRAGDTVASLHGDAMAAGLDAAVAALTGERRLVNDQLGLGPVTGLAQPQLGMMVVKSGRGSGETSGRITGVGGVARIRYGFLERIIRHVVTIEPVDGLQVSDDGDSGSVWLDPVDGTAVALHFAGSDRPERGLAMNMGPVLAALGVRLDTSVTAREPALTGAPR